jgi:hypothetical protein
VLSGEQFLDIRRWLKPSNLSRWFDVKENRFVRAGAGDRAFFMKKIINL